MTRKKSKTHSHLTPRTAYRDPQEDCSPFPRREGGWGLGKPRYRPTGIGAGDGPLVAAPGAAAPPDERGAGAGAGADPGALTAPPGRAAGTGGTVIPTGVGPATVTTTRCATPFSVAVIVPVPGLSPVTFPAASTLTTPGVSDDHCT